MGVAVDSNEQRRQMPRLDEHGLPPATSETPTTTDCDQESDDEVDENAQDQYYDENLDAKDEAWVRKQRSQQADHRSDATLNCPCCFTTLCFDCQRHNRYHNQFRAMFAVSCTVVTDEQLSFQQGRGLSSRENATVDLEEEERYRPVRCEHCNTEVGVYDQDEIFHFFNVAPTAPTV